MPGTHADHDLALEALQTERAVLWAMLDVVAALVIGLDRDGRIVLFNRACENATGYTFDELRGSYFWDRLLLPEEVDGVRTVFSELIAGHFPSEYTNSWVSKNGRQLRIDWKNTAVLGDDGSVRYVIGTGIDISERERMEQALRERAAELRKLSFAMEQSPSTIIITDTEGRIEYVNPKFTKKSGYTLEEVRGKNPRLLKSGDTSDVDYQHLWKTITAGHEWHGVFHNRKKNGELYWEAAYVGPLRDTEGRITHYLSLQEDITEYRRLQERFRRVFESAPNGMVMTDENGRIVLTNRQMEALFGYDRGELVGQPIELLVPERVRELHRAHRERFRREHRPRMMGVNQDLYGRRKDGREFPVEIGLSPLESEEGRLVLAAVADVTARKEAEHEAKRHLEELAHVSRVASIGEMASGLAHEINQPLTAIVSYADACRLMLESGREKKEVLLSSLEEISRQGERAGDIIHRLREFVTRGKLDRRTVSVNQLVHDTLDMLGHELRSHGIDVQLKLAESLPLVEADKVQIEQVIFNLVRNAIEAMESSEPGNRRLTIGTGSVQADEPAIEMFVSDTGEGVSPESSERLFDAFYSTKQSGMGLGLSITRTIINAHGGRIWASVANDRGTTLRFTLPFGDAARR